MNTGFARPRPPLDDEKFIHFPESGLKQAMSRILMVDRLRQGIAASRLSMPLGGTEWVDALTYAII